MLISSPIFFKSFFSLLLHQHLSVVTVFWMKALYVFCKGQNDLQYSVFEKICALKDEQCRGVDIIICFSFCKDATGYAEREADSAQLFSCQTKQTHIVVGLVSGLFYVMCKKKSPSNFLHLFSLYILLYRLEGRNNHCSFSWHLNVCCRAN